jgi:hypothetical protein
MPLRIPPDRRTVMIGWILLIILVLLVLGAIPAWPYSRDWGYYPSGVLGILLLVLLVLILLGVFPTTT